MSYLEQTLAPHEKVVYQANLSWWPHFGWVIISILTIPLFIGVFGLFYLWGHIESTELAVTNKRILVKVGMFSRNTIELNLSHVESIQVHQTFWGRLFNFGTLIISGSGNPQAPLDKIHDPMTFRREALAAQDALLRSYAPQAPSQWDPTQR